MKKSLRLQIRILLGVLAVLAGVCMPLRGLSQRVGSNISDESRPVSENDVPGASLKKVRTDPLPDIWLFCGIPGDDEHFDMYTMLLRQLRDVLKTRFGIPRKKIHIWYHPSVEESQGILTRDNMGQAMSQIVKISQAGTPVWLFFFGHSNPTDKGVNYNLPGPDISAGEIAPLLAGLSTNVPAAIIWATSSSDRYIKLLAGKNRIIISATSSADKDNEPEFPEALIKAIADPKSDRNADGFLSVTELLVWTKNKVKEAYDSQGFLQVEHTLLDGDGDGRGTLRPSRRDATAAESVGLTIVKKHESFD